MIAAPEQSPDVSFAKLPPYDREAEYSLVGSVMLAAGMGEEKLCAESMAGVDSSSFFFHACSLVWEAIVSLREQRRAVDGVTVRAEMEYRKTLDDIGGTPELMKMLSAVPSAAHANHYAEIVRKLAHRRRMIRLTTESLQRLYDRSVDINETTQWLVENAAATQEQNDAIKLMHISEVLAATYDELEKGEHGYYQTGNAEIDSKLGGIGRDGEMIVIGARPSMGKSLVGKDLIYGVAETAKAACLIVSVEEQRDKIGMNFFSNKGLIDNEKIAKRELTDKDWLKMAKVCQQFHDLPVWVTDAASDIDDVCATISIAVAKHKVKVVMVDYLQLISTKNSRNGREAEVASISKRLKNLGKRLGICMIVLAQLNRGNENREEHRPRMSDLRESGQIEQDADRILLLHREDYYHRGEEDYQPSKILEIIVAKNRNGSRQEDLKIRAELKYQRLTVDVFDEAF